jgi:Raf kinase inhibitor-like YbhB/YbcL family protein
MQLTRRGIIAFVVIDIVLIAAAISVFRSRQALAPAPELKEFTKGTMRITSPAFEDGGAVPLVHTCDGRNVSPPLAISGVPAEARSLALVVDDPDATYGTWTHWVLWNVAPMTAEIPMASVPEGSVEGTTSFGRPGYGGPCPPFGTHRYFFKLFALDRKLDLPPSADVAALEKAMEGHVVDKAGLVGTYAKQR